MKTSTAFIILTAVAAAGLQVHAAAQEKVWRCGNEYTNDAATAQQRGCKIMEGGNITIVQGTRSYASAAPSSGGGGASAARSPAGSPRVDGADQKVRDGEARTVLESELRKAQDRQAELVKDYNNGEPEKQGSEGKNYQKYLDRVADMKAQISRNQSDIEGIQRELGRLGVAVTP
jgi:TRAP-type C4-dicarboxylate transport system substrate-binding protein